MNNGKLVNEVQEEQKEELTKKKGGWEEETDLQGRKEQEVQDQEKEKDKAGEVRIPLCKDLWTSRLVGSSWRG